MADKEFEGEKRGIGSYIALTPLMAASAMVVGGVYQNFQGVRQAPLDPYGKVVSGKYRDFFSALEAWRPDVTGMAPEVQEYVLESFRRRLGETGLLITSMNDAVEASKIPSIKLHLKAAFEEFAKVTPGQFGGRMTDIMARAGIKPTPIRTAAGGALTNVEALTRALAEPSLGLGETMQKKLVGELTELGALADDLLRYKPTFEMRTIGKDKAISELIINFYRKGGEVQFKLPIPGESGLLTRANGAQAAARGVLGDLAGFATGAEDLTMLTAPEFAIRRLREILPREDFFQQARQLQQDIRSVLISAPEEEQLLTFASQFVLDPTKKAPQAQVISARRRLAEMGLGAGMPEGPLGKGVFWRPGAQPPPMAPPHYGQAMTKAFPARGPVTEQLFQVSPAAVEEAGRQLGTSTLIPRQDQILLEEAMTGRMQTAIRRRITLDPNAPVSARFEKIMTLLQDNETTRQMLSGGATLEEAMATFERTMTGEPLRQMRQARLLREGEILGFTQAGTRRVKTYGTDMMIRDFETVGGQTIVTTEGFYTPEKIFSPGGLKHSVEYGEAEAVRALGVRAKALELLRARGITEMDPRNPAFALQLQRAEREAQALYAGSVGLVVEGKDWSTWEKIGPGEKNFSRFNQMLIERWRERFGALPAEVNVAGPGQFRERLFAAIRERGLTPEELIGPMGPEGEILAPYLARRVEELRPGAAAGTLGIGRYGVATFTDDAFEIMARAGWKNMYEAMAMRVDRDAAAMSTLIRAGQAARATAGGVTIQEMLAQGWLRPGEGMAGTIFDPEARARFISETGGMIQLPHEYRIEGMRVSRIAVPEFPSGFAGQYMTEEGQLILKDLDAALRDVMTASIVDVGASGVTAGELAATEPLGRFMQALSRMQMQQRDIVGGRIVGSRRFAIGKDVFAEEVERITTRTGAIAPRGGITPQAFEQWMTRAEELGLLREEGLAEFMRERFYQGRLAIPGMKHPGRGMGFLPFYLGPTPKGFRGSQDMMYLSESLLPSFVGDLDFDPFESDMLFSRAAIQDADEALMSGQVNMMIDEVNQIREWAKIKRGRYGAGVGVEVFDPVTGEPLPEFLAQSIERRARAKRNVGIFTTRVTWPMGVAGETAELSFQDWIRMRVWRESLEEAATLKTKLQLGMPGNLVDEMAEAWRAGRVKTISTRVTEMFGLGEEASASFSGLLGRLSTAYQNMSVADREFAEALYSGKARAGARQFLTFADRTTVTSLAAGRTIADLAGAGTKFSGVVSRTLAGVGNVLRSKRKPIAIALGASAAIAALTAKPRDLTPERVESGRLAGEPMREPTPAPPMPPIKRKVYYQQGSKPGYRATAVTNRIADHERLARAASKLTGGMPIAMNVTDSRRKITKEDVEMAMMKDDILGARQLESRYYNARESGRSFR